MENDMETNSSSNDASESSSEANNNAKQQRRKSINLLKRSKHDLLRLLSILEGELEARDFFISNLQAELNNQKNAKRNYFVHRLNDPLLSLHRDDCVVGNGDGKINPNELGYIEPLPLLEKIVFQFKTQQQKMHQQMSLASKIHRKMAHELAEEKRKHASDTKTGDDVTMALEKEKERLNARIMCERERTKRIEREYKKLLGLCKEEGKKHQVIVMALLTEQERLLQQLKQSRELQIDIDSTETELQARLHEALKEKQELAMKLKEEQTKNGGLESEIRKLQQLLTQKIRSKNLLENCSPKKKSALEQAAALYSCDEYVDDDSEEDEDSIISAPELPVKKSRASSAPAEFIIRAHRSSNPETAAFFSKHHPMSVAQSTQDVTLIPTSCHPPILLADGVGVTTSGYYSVKPGSSIAGLEAMKSTATSKEMLSLEFVSDEVFEPSAIESAILNPVNKEKRTDDEPKRPNTSPKTVPPKPNRFVPGTPHFIPFRSPHSLFNDKSQISVASSPTSGATNFAMNSPNSPNPPQSSPFAITRSPTVKSSSKLIPGRNDTTKKVSSLSTKLSSSGRISAKPVQNTQFQATRMKFQNIPTVNGDLGVNNSSKENMVEKRMEQRQNKLPTTAYKSQITQRVGNSTTLPTVVSSVKPEVSLSEVDRIKQPLPPKTRPSNTNSSNNGNQVRPPPLPPKKPSLSSDKPVKRSSTSVDNSKPSEPAFQRKSGSVIKRIVPLSPSTKGNESTTNGSVGKIAKGPTPPSLPAKMTSQQPTPPAGPRQNHSTSSRASSDP